MRRNLWKFILSFLAGNMSLYLLYKHKFTKKAVDDKDKRYLQLFDKWMILMERGDAIEQFFKEKNIKEIAIYGYGNIGKHLVTQLSDSDINIKFVIDRRKDSIIVNSIPCYQPSDNLPSVDAIVITPICEYTEIKNALNEVTSAKIISIEDIVYELL
jgi:hypothetical protein